MAINANIMTLWNIQFVLICDHSMMRKFVHVIKFRITDRLNEVDNQIPYNWRDFVMSVLLCSRYKFECNDIHCNSRSYSQRLRKSFIVFGSFHDKMLRWTTVSKKWKKNHLSIKFYKFSNLYSIGFNFLSFWNHRKNGEWISHFDINTSAFYF